MGELLAPHQMCAKLPGTTRGYWAQLRYSGKGPRFFKPSGKVVLYDEDDVDEWLRASARTQTGPSAA